MSKTLRDVLEARHADAVCGKADDLVFQTPKGTPLSPKNLYNRVLAPACDRIGRTCFVAFLPPHACNAPRGSRRVLKTAQVLLGHSDVETTLNTYVHAAPDSQRRR